MGTIDTTVIAVFASLVLTVAVVGITVLALTAKSLVAARPAGPVRPVRQPSPRVTHGRLALHH